MTTTGLEAFDWGRGRWVNGLGPQARAEIVIASDWAPIRAFDGIVARSPESVYGDLLPVLRKADLRIVNLECALSGGGSPVWKSGSVFKGRPEHIKGLTAVPFEVVTLANNHVFDYGPEAFNETLRLLDENAIRSVGAGMSPDEARRPLILEVNGVGYRAEVQNKNLVLNVGYSHPVIIEPPAGLSFEVEVKTRQIKVHGADKQQVGQMAADIRKVRPPEPYLGKGIKYLEETIRRKAGKSGKG